MPGRAGNVFDIEGFRIAKLTCNNGLPCSLKNHTEGVGANEREVRMKDHSMTMAEKKTVAIVAHDNKKQDLLAWAKFNRDALDGHNLIATGTTGKLLQTELNLPVERLQSGPLGGDQQIGAKISEGKIDILIFFWDPLEPHPHDPDVKALLRIAVVWNIPIACNRASADFLISSSLMPLEYQRLVPDYEGHRNRVPRLDVA
jgi:methylglyoxal synthase